MYSVHVHVCMYLAWVIVIFQPFLAPRVGIAVRANGSMTSGMVGEMQHQVLPTVSPLATMILTLVAMTVSSLMLLSSGQ